jgi:hypothetical protein
MLFAANRPRSASLAVPLPSRDEAAISALLSLTGQQRFVQLGTSPATVLNAPNISTRDPSNEYDVFRVSNQELQEIEEFASISSPVNRRRAFSEGYIDNNFSHSSNNSNHNVYLNAAAAQQQSNLFEPLLATKNNDIGKYSPKSRRKRIDRFLTRRKRRVWAKTIKYSVRKNFADSRLRVKGRFVKKEDETILRELMNLV